jgi:peptidyl-prolyl cis-trans isomerase D
VALDTLRKGAGRLFGMILMGILVVSFGIWGIADIFRGYGQQSLVRVGDIEIGQQDYLRVQREVVQTMSQEAGKNLSVQDARAQGLDAQVLERVLGGAAVDNHARDLGLGISNKALIKQITQEPSFKDQAGNFDPAAFQQALESLGMSEQGYLDDQRQRDLRRQLLATLSDAVVAPNMLIQALNIYNNETRTLRYVLVPEDAVPPSPAPTETELKSYYDNHQSTFTVPEYRKIGVLSVSPETVKDQVKITDKELKDAYEAQKSKFETPEKRDVHQISFPTEQAAQAAYEKIQSGTSFDDIAKQRGLKPSDTDLGLQSQLGMADPALADAAFKLKKGEVSRPVKGKLGAIALLEVTDIVPGKTSSFDKEKAGIRQKILTDRAQDAILDLHDKIEDDRASGMTLAEVAAKLKLPFQQVDQIDAEGKDPSGAEVTLPQKSQLVKAAFASDVGVDNDPLDAGQDGFVWYTVEGITPQRVKPLAQVKDEVTKLWSEDDRQSRLAQYTQGLMKKLESGKMTFEDVANEVKAPLQTTAPFKRSGIALNVLPPAVKQAFALPLHGYGSAESGVQGARILFQVASITLPKPVEGPTKVELQHQLQQFVSDDILSEYFAALEKRYPVSINHEALDRLNGSDQQP